MKELKQLRHYIPLSGPSTREVATGAESDFRISIGFTPNWFHKRLGIDFSERWHKDPVYRYGTVLQMKQYLNNLLPELDDFKLQFDDKGIETTCSTLGAVYGTCPITSVYGIPMNYRQDGWPDTHIRYTKEQFSKMKPIIMEDNPFVQELMEQMDIMEENYGRIYGYLNYQGVLNNAFRLLGEEIFVAVLEDPPFAEFVFNHVCETMIDFVKLVQARQRRSGFDVNFLSVSNCVINMMSVDLYEEFLLPLDQRLEKEFDIFGLHTCNWESTRFFESFRKIGHLGYLDMGITSDMKKAREMFPDTRIAVLYHPNEIADAPLDKMRRDFEKIYADAAPVDIALADIDTEVSDERVREVIKLAYEMEQKYRK